jgi:hypothetical protein
MVASVSHGVAHLSRSVHIGWSDHGRNIRPLLSSKRQTTHVAVKMKYTVIGDLHCGRYVSIAKHGAEQKY